VVVDQQPHGVVVGHDHAVEAELAAQELVEDGGAPGARDAVDRGVRVHDRGQAGVPDGCRERLGVHLPQLAWSEVDRRVVHAALGEAVAEEVLAGGDHARPEVVALEAAHVRRPHPPDQVRVLAVGLLDPPPARVARDVEHR
jgi:hypothetical protein